MNLLASAAVFGVLTLAVSGGLLGDLVGIQEATPVPILLPVGHDDMHKHDHPPT